jgi:sugar lactone lactonase YvrE
MGEPSHRAKGFKGSLWQIQLNKSETCLLNNLFIPNGHCFIPLGDGNYRLFLNDSAKKIANPSTEKSIDEYLYSPKSQKLISQGYFYEFPAQPLDRFPDGMAISKDYKYLFIPLFYGSAVEIIDIQKRTSIGKVQIPNASQVTSIAILADGRAIITTASEGYLPHDFQENSNAGCLFSIDLNPIGIKGSEIYRAKLC